MQSEATIGRVFMTVRERHIRGGRHDDRLDGEILADRPQNKIVDRRLQLFGAMAWTNIDLAHVSRRAVQRIYAGNGS